VRVYGDAALVTGRSVQKGEENGKDYSGAYWFTRALCEAKGAMGDGSFATTLIEK
jgi:hypothetical protein